MDHALAAAEPVAQPHALPAWFAGGLLVLVLAVFALNLVGLDRQWLWSDEIWSVTLSKDGPWTALLNAVRFDLHPPLYVLQFSVWMWFGDSDRWLMFNSVAWTAFAAASLAYTSGRLYGPRTGLLAGLLLALAPAMLQFSDGVRMYPMLVALIVWAWYALVRWLDDPYKGWASLWFVVSQAAVSYTHGAGVIMLSGVVLYGAARVLLRRDTRLALRWLGLEVLGGVLVVPNVVMAALRGAHHPVAPGLADFVKTWSFLSTGLPSLAPVVLAISVVVLVALLAVMLRGGDTGLQVAMLVFAPLVLAAIASYAVKPVWLNRTFMTVVPFMCLGLARGVASVVESAKGRGRSWKWAAAVPAVLLAALFVTDLRIQSQRTKGDGFRPAAAAVRQMAKPGDLIVAGPHYNYWYFLWYFLGRDWGKPLHAFILNDDWRRMLARVPQPVLKIFDMSESDRLIQVGDVQVTLWDRERPLPPHTGAIIVVGPGEMADIEPPGYRRAERFNYPPVTVQRWEPDR
jgi:hypothetical protein